MSTGYLWRLRSNLAPVCAGQLAPLSSPPAWPKVRQMSRSSVADDGTGPAPEAPPWAVLQALNDTDPLDAEAAEALRLAHCTICRTNQELPEKWRRGQCEKWRCGLRSPRKLHEEKALLIKLIKALDGASSETARRALNMHIWQCAAVTPGLGMTEDGHTTESGTGSSLLATLHLATVSYLARRGGEVRLNFNEHTAKEAARIVKEFRAIRDKERGDEDDRRVRELANDGVSISAIAIQLGWGNDRQRVRESLNRTREGGASCNSSTTSA
jgi:hypothetical protein